MQQTAPLQDVLQPSRLKTLPRRSGNCSSLQALLDLIAVLQGQGLGNGNRLQQVDKADDDGVAKLLANIGDAAIRVPPADCLARQALGDGAHHPDGGGAHLVPVGAGALNLEDVDDGNAQHCNSDGAYGTEEAKAPAQHKWKLVSWK